MEDRSPASADRRWLLLAVLSLLGAWLGCTKLPDSAATQAAAPDGRIHASFWFFDGGRNQEVLEELTGWLFMAPSLLLFGIFVLYPVINGARLSLHHWNMLLPPRFVGLQNFQELVLGGKLGPAAAATLIFSLIILGLTRLQFRVQGRRSSTRASGSAGTC